MRGLAVGARLAQVAEVREAHAVAVLDLPVAGSLLEDLEVRGRGLVVLAVLEGVVGLRLRGHHRAARRAGRQGENGNGGDEAKAELDAGRHAGHGAQSYDLDGARKVRSAAKNQRDSAA